MLTAIGLNNILFGKVPKEVYIYYMVQDLIES